MLFIKRFFIIVSLVSCVGIFAQNNISGIGLIKKVIENKSKNKPDNFEFGAYNNFIVTANPDSIQGNIDSVYVVKKNRNVFSKIDSSDYVFKKIISKQHLYQTERISQFQSLNNTLKENILATRMAGFKQPLYEYFALKLMPFSIYDERFVILEKDYISPLTYKGLKKYTYQLIEEINCEDRIIHKILFYDKNFKKTNRLEGFIYVDAEKFSVSKMEIKTSGILNIYAVYNFNFNAEINNWFPEQQSILVKKGNSKKPFKIFGETISFEGMVDGNNSNRKKYASDFVEIKSVTKIFEPSFNKIKSIRKPYISTEINEKAIAKNQDFWYTHFNDSIDVRSNPTYVSIDSLVQKRKFDKKINLGLKLYKGILPLSLFDFDLRHLLKYNNYEGVRIGIGGTTNDKLSNLFKVGYYGAYGSRDGVFKGHIAPAIRIGKSSESWVGVSFTEDVKDIASTAFELDKQVYTLFDSRPFSINSFYKIRTWKTFLETKLIPKTNSIWYLSRSFNEAKFDYLYELNGKSYSRFFTSMATVSLEWSPYSKYMQTPNKRIEIEKNYPKFTFQFSKTLPGVLQNDFDFGKFDLRFNYQKKFNSAHKLMFLFEGGYAFGDTPLTHLYNHSANNLNSNSLIERSTIAADDSFETMYFKEFYSSKYVFMQLEHQFPKIRIAKNVNPIVSLITRCSFGDMDNKEQHKQIIFKTLEKGYFESGLEINQIFAGLGLVAYYRHGANHLPRFIDNVSINLSFDLDLGF
jgi:hypothetical protein